MMMITIKLNRVLVKLNRVLVKYQSGSGVKYWVSRESISNATHAPNTRLIEKEILQCTLSLTRKEVDGSVDGNKA